MAGGNFWAKFFGIEDEESVENRTNSQEFSETSNSKELTIQDAISFVSEIQSYYFNDICKTQADIAIHAASVRGKEDFFRKKVKQSQLALAQIDLIFEEMKQNETDYQSIWRKSIYSFYDELEQSKQEEAKKKAFEIILRLCEVNVNPELQSIITERIKKYKEAWKITEYIEIPQNTNVILVESNGDVEKYQFGKFLKEVNSNRTLQELTTSQLDAIRKMKISVENIKTDSVWIYVSGVTRLQLNFMRRDCFISNQWEHSDNNYEGFFLDVVDKKDLEIYLKGVLQLVLTQNRYAVISFVVPTEKMKGLVGKVQIIGGKVQICREINFFLNERKEEFGSNIFTTRIDKRNIPEEMSFVSYIEFKKQYF